MGRFKLTRLLVIVAGVLGMCAGFARAEEPTNEQLKQQVAQLQIKVQQLEIELLKSRFQQLEARIEQLETAQSDSLSIDDANFEVLDQPAPVIETKTDQVSQEAIEEPLAVDAIEDLALSEQQESVAEQAQEQIESEDLAIDIEVSVANVEEASDLADFEAPGDVVLNEATEQAASATQPVAATAIDQSVADQSVAETTELTDELAPDRDEVTVVQLDQESVDQLAGPELP